MNKPQIQYKDLRIGNFFKQGAFPFQITEDILRNILTKGIEPSLDKMEYMEITEEILIDLGFIKDADYYSFKDFHYHLPSGNVYFGNDHVSSGHVDANTKYVSELQNIFNDIKKLELIVKLDI